MRTVLFIVLSTNLHPFSFPGKEHVTGSYKIPTIMYYDREGNMKAGGAETEDMLMASLAEDNGWTKVELCAFSSSFTNNRMLRIFNILS